MMHYIMYTLGWDIVKHSHRTWNVRDKPWHIACIIDGWTYMIYMDTIMMSAPSFSQPLSTAVCGWRLKSFYHDVRSSSFWPSAATHNALHIHAVPKPAACQQRRLSPLLSSCLGERERHWTSGMDIGSVI